MVSDPTNGSGNPAPPPVKLPASHLAKENLIPIPKEWKESSTRDGKCHRVDVSNTHLRRSIERVRADLSADHGQALYRPPPGVTHQTSEGWLLHARVQAMHKTSHHNCKGRDGIGLTAGCKVLRVERIENMLLWKQYCAGPAALEPQPCYHERRGPRLTVIGLAMTVGVGCAWPVWVACLREPLSARLSDECACGQGIGSARSSTRTTPTRSGSGHSRPSRRSWRTRG